MKTPNILFIHVDQMHFQAISAYGCEHVKTPHLDRMVREGYSFMRMHSVMPQCCPARASWYTGRTSKEHGVVVNGCPIDPKLPDLGQWLREKAGYETVHTGKWHVSGRNVEPSFKYLRPHHGHGEVQDADVARSVVSFLKTRTNDRPFFLSVGFLNPHDCCFPAMASGGPAKYGFAPKVEDELPPLPENFDYEYKAKKKGSDWSLRDWRYYIYHYYRLVEMVDAQIGRVYQALQESPYADNTMVIFVSDHGDGLGFHANVSKGYMEEEAWRVPAIVCWPGHVPAGKQDEEHLVSLQDIAATACDYAGAPPLPKNTTARSWKPLLEEQDVPWRDYVVGETSIGRLSVGIREKRYKTIFYTDQIKLYDMDKDPMEMNDLASNAEHTDIIERHRGHFREFLGKIEIYREPNWDRLKPNQAKLYRAYVAWYDEMAKEA